MHDAAKYLDPHLAHHLAKKMPQTDAQAVSDANKAFKPPLPQALDHANQAAKPLLDLLANEELLQQLKAKNTLTISHLAQEHAVTTEHVAALADHAKLLYESGDYATASIELGLVRALATADLAFSVLWGKTACDLLLADGPRATQAVQAVTALREAIDARASTTAAAVLLQQRAWLMHWALVALPQGDGGVALIAEMFASDGYVNVIQSLCPHLLRYLAATVLMSPRKRSALQELVKLVRLLRRDHSDAITSLVEDLYFHASFDDAQKRLAECATALAKDWFLANMTDAFMSAARLHIFESYCRIHSRISLSALGAKLGMEDGAAEKWIAKMISGAQLNASIDSASGQVLFGNKPPDVYEQMIERTKGLTFRTNVLSQNFGLSAKR